MLKAMLPVAILAGGLASRLQPLTRHTPKSLVVVAGRPFIFHQLELLHSQGVRRVVLCVGHLGEQIEAAVGDGRRFGLDVEYSFDGSRLLGTGGALKRAIRALKPVSIPAKLPSWRPPTTMVLPVLPPVAAAGLLVELVGGFVLLLPLLPQAAASSATAARPTVDLTLHRRMVTPRGRPGQRECIIYILTSL